MRYVIQFVKNFISGKVLDAGSGLGDEILTNEIQNVTKIDIKRGKGIEKVDLNAFPLPFNEKEFDTVLCSHVLEHLYSPYLVLKEFKRILKDDGILIIALPNPHFIFSMQMGKPEHINLICETSMQNIVEKIGFKVIKKYYNWLFIKNKRFGKLCQHLPMFLRTDYWLICEKVRV